MHIAVEGKKVIQGVSLAINPGEVHALMGPNGSGKSTLALAAAGHPGYEILKGRILLGSKNINRISPEKRAQAGLFLAFQHPSSVEGVSVYNFLKAAAAAQGQKSPPAEFLKNLQSLSKAVGLDEEFLKRDLNLGFSGGEKKRFEILQALALRPRVAVFDEIDSGLDVDALRLIAAQIRKLAESGTGVLAITHYQRILKHLKPDFVHVMVNGRLVESGGPKLAGQLERTGYQKYQ
ncbi:MAG: Fe-S cluster assembly ATPase SufC [bacterium]|nr:Fe-S cluster assembly ATPase SufC [bacterium]